MPYRIGKKAAASVPAAARVSAGPVEEASAAPSRDESVAPLGLAPCLDFLLER